MRLKITASAGQRIKDGSNVAKCLVTGGAGFIGGHIARRLLKSGHQVSVLENFSHTSVSRFPQGAKCITANVEAWGTYQLEQFDVIFHCAAISRTPPAVADPATCMRVNVMGTFHILDACRARLAKSLHVPKIIISSSNVVLAGETVYKVSKQACEGLALTYHDLYRVPCVALRYSNVYGSGLMKGDVAVFSSLRDSATNDGVIRITGDGEQSRDFTHVDDIVWANILAWQSDYYGPALDICTGENTSMNTIAPWFECPVKYIGDRLGDAKHIVQDPRDAERAIGFKANISLRQGFKDIWRDVHDPAK